MKQITIRGIDPKLERRLRSLAEAQGVSLGQAALRLLEQAVETASKAGASSAIRCELPSNTAGEEPGVIGNSLDEFIGTWNDQETREFNAMIEETCERIDEDAWK